MTVTSMTEAIDRIILTDKKRLAASISFASVGRKVDKIHPTTRSQQCAPISPTFWYISVTCSNNTWFNSELVKGSTAWRVKVLFDINSLLGAIAKSTMCRFVPLSLRSTAA